MGFLLTITISFLCIVWAFLDLYSSKGWLKGIRFVPTQDSEVLGELLGDVEGGIVVQGVGEHFAKEREY